MSKSSNRSNQKFFGIILAFKNDWFIFDWCSNSAVYKKSFPMDQKPNLIGKIPPPECYMYRGANQPKRATSANLSPMAAPDFEAILFVFRLLF